MLIGKELNHDTIQSNPQYEHTTINPQQLSQAAMVQRSNIFSNGITLQMVATNRVMAMKEEDGSNHIIQIIIYNASGETLTYQENYNWMGGTSKYPLDSRIANGTYSVFLHVDWNYPSGATVYRGTSGSDFLLAWRMLKGGNVAYVDVQNNDYWPQKQSWSMVEEKLIVNERGNRNVVFDNGIYLISPFIGYDQSPIAAFTIARKA